MFENFTDNAIKVIALAQNEAHLLEHNCVTTGHLLLGIIAQDTDTGAKILKSMGVNLEDARIKTEKIIRKGSHYTKADLPFNDPAKRIFQLSANKSHQLGDDYVTAQHLLWALTGDILASSILKKLGVNPRQLKTQLVQVLTKVENTSTSITNQSFQPLKVNQGIAEEEKTRDSILLVGLIHSLVFIGIIAIDFFAVTNTSSTSIFFSLWAIPLISFAIGIGWAKRNKHQNNNKLNLAVNVCIWIAIIMCYLWLTQPTTSSLPLLIAGFSIRVQLIFSLNFYLGASMINSLILIGVAGSLSDDSFFLFTAWLIIFSIVAIPTLSLYHRFKMGLSNWENRSLQQKQKSSSSLNTKIFGNKTYVYALIILFSGLIISAILPRYNYQPQSLGGEGGENGRSNQGELGDGEAKLLDKIKEFFAELFGNPQDKGNGYENQPDWLGLLWQLLINSLVIILLIIIVAVICWFIFKYFKNKTSTTSFGNKLHPVAKLYREMLNLLDKKGHPKRLAQTPYEYTSSLEHIFLAEQLEIINLITNNYVTWRYGDITPNTDYLRSQFLLLKKSFRQTKRSNN